MPCRRSHEFRTNRITDRFAQDLIDLSFGGSIERKGDSGLLLGFANIQSPDVARQLGQRILALM